MRPKTILITGSTDGIGRQAAFVMAAKGNRVIVHGRNPQKCTDTVQWIREGTENKATEWICADLSSLNEIRGMAEEITQRFKRLDVLINNAGVFQRTRTLSRDGYELTFAVNHLAHFLLTGLLLNLLLSSSPARIVTVSSMAHASAIDFDDLQGEVSYSGYQAYAMSKLANILFTFELAERLKGKNIAVNCLHPGVIDTKLLHAGWGLGGAPVSVGADVLVYLATAPETESVTGKYFSDKQIQEPAAIAYDDGVRKKLWEISERLTDFHYPL